MSVSRDHIQRLTVVVLNWNGRDDTIRCVRSLVDVGNIPLNEVTVVDNASSDDSVAALRRAYPDLRVIINETNLGFAGGMNIGVADAIGRGSEFICILNNDTVTEANTFERLIDAAKEGAATSPEVRYLGQPDNVWFGAGTVERIRCWPRHLTAQELRVADAAAVDPSVRYSETLAGCCILARSEIWQSVGFFDERYFLLFEDADWSARAREVNVRMKVVRQAILYHKVSASFAGSGRLLAAYYYSRNGLLFGRLHCRESKLSRLRFLRDQVARPAMRDLRQGRRTEALGSILFSSLGCAAAALSIFGRAPTWIEGLAARLAGRKVLMETGRK